MQNLLIVSAISEVKSDKNEREYKTVTVSQAPKFRKLPNGKTVAIRAKLKSTALNAYANNYLDQEDMLWSATLGEYVEGSLVSRATTEYTIVSKDGTRVVSSATVPVFADATDGVFEKEVEKAFYNAAFTSKTTEPRFELIGIDGHESEEVITEGEIAEMAGE
jgi:hypothetical protein